MNEPIVESIRQKQAGALRTIESLRSQRQLVDEAARQLESPRAAYEHIDFFVDFFSDLVSELDALVEQLPAGARPSDLHALAQVTARAAAEEQRCRQFADKWVSKPLPYESARPLLTKLHADVRDRLVELRQLGAFKPELVPAAVKMDRRELWSRLTGGGKGPPGDR